MAPVINKKDIMLMAENNLIDSFILCKSAIACAFSLAKHSY
jgi:hypothetical protein